MSGNYIEVVASLESPHVVRMTHNPGRIMPRHASSLGKAAMAPQPEAVQRKPLCLGQFTPATIINEAALKAQLNTTRARGYAIGAVRRAAQRIGSSPECELPGGGESRVGKPSQR